MNPVDIFNDGRCVLHQGDVLAVLRTLPADSVQVVVTSPPYFTLRSYLPKGHPDKAKEIGSEPKPEAFIETMVRVFRDVRRVLRDDGVCFVNLGDGYCCDSKWGGSSGSKNELQQGYPRHKRGDSGLSDGQLQNIPHRVAEALRGDGWIWRQTIIWAKRSPLPESVQGWRWVRCQKRTWPAANVDADPELRRDRQAGRDFGKPEIVPCPGCPKCLPNGGWVLRKGKGRCTTGHEYVFILTKSPCYFWDSQASKEPASTGAHGGGRNHPGRYTHLSGRHDQGAEFNAGIPGGINGRNPRTVWPLSSEPTKLKHFAAFPTKLVEKCLKAALPSHGVCPECGAAWAPMVDSHHEALRPSAWNDTRTRHEDRLTDARGHGGWKSNNLRTISSNLGYRPTCSCGRADTKPALVLDPFCGIGTVGVVALRMGGAFVGIDLNPAYVAMAQDRIGKAAAPATYWSDEGEELPLFGEHA